MLDTKYLLPLVDEFQALGEEYSDPETAWEFVEADHSLVPFYIPSKACWSHLVHFRIVCAMLRI